MGTNLPKLLQLEERSFCIVQNEPFLLIHSITCHLLGLSFLTNRSENKGIKLITNIFYNSKYLKFYFLESYLKKRDNIHYPLKKNYVLKLSPITI